MVPHSSQFPGREIHLEYDLISWRVTFDKMKKNDQPPAMTLASQCSGLLGMRDVGSDGEGIQNTRYAVQTLPIYILGRLTSPRPSSQGYCALSPGYFRCHALYPPSPVSRRHHAPLDCLRSEVSSLAVSGATPPNLFAHLVVTGITCE